MTHGSLFSGIGGFDLAAEWMGWQNIFQVEIEEYCQRLLAQNFPNVERHRDIREFDGKQYAGRIDIISGGFPCQPFSQAGKRQGKDDPRHLWPQMLRIISEIEPRWVLGENVSGIFSWSGGLVFDEIQSDLADIGYETIPVRIPAVAVGAPHRRDRWWFVANSNSKRLERRSTGGKGEEKQITKRHTRQVCRSFFGWEKNWLEVAAELCVLGNGLPVELDGFTLSKSKHREHQLKGLGNAIVPQVALEIIIS